MVFPLSLAALVSTFLLSYLTLLATASPSLSHRLAPHSASNADLEPFSDPSSRTNTLPRRHDHLASSSLPDSIRDFRFNAPPTAHPVHHLDPEASPGDRRSTPFGEPLIDDLTLSPVVLAVTVDGQVHALKRETGQWLWTLHDDGGAALGGASAKERSRRSKVGGMVGSPLVRAVGRRSAGKAANETGLIAEAIKGAEDEDEVYVIEPFSGGDIYRYARDASPSGGTLEKLPLSMQELVTLSPFTFPSDSSRMFAGRKETNLVGVDLRTGRLVGVFGSGAGWCEWDASKQGTVRTEEECEEEISRRPEDLLYMARTEYHLSIYSKAGSAPLQTLTYTTYTSSSLGSALQEQWTQTPDGRYLQPMHDGLLLSFLDGVPGHQWAVRFDHPVVSVFDIALPPASPSDLESPQPLMFEQPRSLPMGHHRVFGELGNLPEAAFIGKVDGDLFALSRDHFPLVAFAPAHEGAASTIGGGLDPGGSTGDFDDESSAPKCRGLDCLVGRHLLAPSSTTSPDNTIDPPSERLRIEGPPADQTTPTPHSSASSPPPPNRSSTLTEPYHFVRNLSSAKSSSIITALLMILGYLSFRKLWSEKTQHAVESKVRTLGHDWLNLAVPPSSQDGQNLDSSLPPQTSGGTIGVPSALPPVVLEAAPFSPPPALFDLRSPATPPPPNTTSLPASLLSTPSSSPTATRTRSPSLSSPPLESKELPPIPSALTEGLDEDSDAEADNDPEAKDGGPETPKQKKSSRRRRGKKKKGFRVGSEEAAPGGLAGLFGTEGEGMRLPMPLEAELKALTLGEAEVKEDVMDVSEMGGKTDPQMIGGLTVSETILGYGSHGTVVLRGEFQGRAVAVKRLLKDFVTIATHEVALLQESDDHPHVIRYFCKEQRDTFLYIALELCPASLFDLIDQAASYPSLVRDFDPKRALRQITSGIRHLHKLKIVHRDIKPQNILVSTSKHGGVRMLISDFGLCKKLDVDESSFQQTMNHAAGSFGYRAPEVLRGQVDPDFGATATPSNGTLDSGGTTTPAGPGSVGSGTNADPALRLTRSIDVFSLGCIAYYVLTGGEHPFGGRYEREMNILRGRSSLESLDGLGEEALEAQDLITRMVANDPRERPSAEAVLLHPFFWNAQKRLLFLCDASDRFEIMERDPPEQTLVTLEHAACDIVGDDWQKGIDRTLLDNLGKYRKYDGKSVRDVLRVLRNKKHHYQDLPEAVRKHLGDLPGGFLSYFTSRFPRLLLHVYDAVSTHLSEEAMFASTFRLADEEH